MAINFVVATSLSITTGGIGNIDVVALGMAAGDICRVYDEIGEHTYKLVSGTATISEYPLKISAKTGTFYWERLNLLKSSMFSITDLYVDGSATDDTGTGLTVGSPKKYIQSAVDMIGPTITGDVTVHIAEGTYSEDVVIPRIFGGYVVFDCAITATFSGTLFENLNLGTVQTDGDHHKIRLNESMTSGAYDTDYGNTCYFVHNTTKDKYGVVIKNDTDSLYTLGITVPNVYALSPYDAVNDAVTVYQPGVKINTISANCSQFKMNRGWVAQFNASPSTQAYLFGSRVSALDGSGFSSSLSNVGDITGYASCYIRMNYNYGGITCTGILDLCGSLCVQDSAGTGTSGSIFDASKIRINNGTYLLGPGKSSVSGAVGKTFQAQTSTTIIVVDNYPSAHMPLRCRVVGFDYGSYLEYFGVHTLTNHLDYFGHLVANGTAGISGNTLTDTGAFTNVDFTKYNYGAFRVTSGNIVDSTNYTYVTGKTDNNTLTLADGTAIGNANAYQIRIINNNYKSGTKFISTFAKSTASVTDSSDTSTQADTAL